jgi:hypothetical protein
MLQDLLSAFISFEGHAQRFDGTALVGIGIALLVLGLVIWLAGIAFSRVIAAIIAALASFYAAAVLTGGRVSVAIFACATGLIVGAILRRLVFTALVAALVLSCTLIAFSEPTHLPMKMSLGSPVSDGPILSMSQSWHRTSLFATDLYANLRTLGAKQSLQIYSTAGAAAFVAFVLIFFLKNFGAALACSAVGTMMSLLGMVVLLFYRG